MIFSSRFNYGGIGQSAHRMESKGNDPSEEEKAISNVSGGFYSFLPLEILSNLHKQHVALLCLSCPKLSTFLVSEV